MPTGSNNTDPLVDAQPTSVTTPSNDNTDLRPGKRPQRLPEYDKTTDVLKVILANRMLIAHGVPYAFSLNLTPKEIEKALASKEGPRKWCAARLRRWLEQVLGYVPPHWFVLECDRKTNRLHLHGGIVLDHNVVPAACEALRKAGGEWANLLGRQFQLKLKAQYAPDGWATYCLKDRGFTKRVIGTDALVFIPNDLRGHAKRLLQAERRRQDVATSEPATSADEVHLVVSFAGDPKPFGRAATAAPTPTVASRDHRRGGFGPEESGRTHDHAIARPDPLPSRLDRDANVRHFDQTDKSGERRRKVRYRPISVGKRPGSFRTRVGRRADVSRSPQAVPLDLLDARAGGRPGAGHDRPPGPSERRLAGAFEASRPRTPDNRRRLRPGANGLRGAEVDIGIRGDSHDARPEAMTWLGRNHVGYISWRDRSRRGRQGHVSFTPSRRLPREEAGQASNDRFVNNASVGND